MLRVLFAVLAVVSLIMIAGVVFAGLKIDDTRAGLWDADDDRVLSVRRDMAGQHLAVTIVSLLFYLAGAGVLLLGIILDRATGWRIALGVAMAGCLGMALWSLLLGPAVSFDEVYIAWVVFLLLLVGIGIAGCLRKAKAKESVSP